MSLKKTVAIAAAAGALAALSVPAMALENEFHGSYTFNSVFSNFSKGDGAQINPATYRDDNKMNNYFEQRARIQYIAKVSDDLKLVTHFELDSRFGGVTDGKYNGSNDGGTLDADGISLETKHVYLDFNLGKNFNTKLGIQPYKDTLKGLFIDADIPAIMTTTKMGAYTLGLGFTRFNENEQKTVTTSRLGDLATDLFIMDNKFAFGKDTSAALSYYFLANYKTADQASLVHTFGLSGESKMGPVTLSAFAAMQAGHQKNSTNAGVLSAGKNSNYHGYALNLAAKMAAGPGTAKAAVLYASGNNNNDTQQNRGWVNSGINSYNESGMMIIARNTANSPSNTDDYLRRMVTNIAIGSLGYDANLSDKMYLNTNLGFAWAPSSTGAPVDVKMGPNASDFMGTEMNVELGYKVYESLTLRAQAAYMVLGSFYTNSATNSTVAAVKDPEDPYIMRLLASFKF